MARLFFGPEGENYMKITTTDELRARIARDEIILLDVRGDGPYEKEHIVRSLSVPLDQMKVRLDELAGEDARIAKKDQPIITYCGSLTCPMSERAAKKLDAMGYTDVTDYAEGIAGWKEAGLQTERAEASAAGP